MVISDGLSRLWSFLMINQDSGHLERFIKILVISDGLSRFWSFMMVYQDSGHF